MTSAVPHRGGIRDRGSESEPPSARPGAGMASVPPNRAAVIGLACSRDGCWPCSSGQVFTAWIHSISSGAASAAGPRCAAGQRLPRSRHPRGTGRAAGQPGGRHHGRDDHRAHRHYGRRAVRIVRRRRLFDPPPGDRIFQVLPALLFAMVVITLFWPLDHGGDCNRRRGLDRHGAADAR